MTIIESLETLNGQIEAHERAVDTVARRQVYTALLEVVQRRLAKGESLRLQWEAFIENEIPIVLEIDGGKFLSLLTQILAEAEDVPERLRTASKWNDLEEAEASLRGELRRTWDLARDGLTALRPEISPLLRKEATEEQLSRIEAIDRQLEKLPVQPPDSPEVYATAREVLAERQTIFKKLRDAIPDEIEELLERIGSGSVTLADVTEKEFSLIQQSGWGSAIRIALT